MLLQLDYVKTYVNMKTMYFPHHANLSKLTLTLFWWILKCDSVKPPEKTLLLPRVHYANSTFIVTGKLVHSEPLSKKIQKVDTPNGLRFQLSSRNIFPQRKCCVSTILITISSYEC